MKLEFIEPPEASAGNGDIGNLDDREYGDLLVEYLEDLGVEYVFGVPGGAIEPFVNALARSERRGGVRCITSRHETGAGFFAEGYYNSSGKLGVCFGTTGPGTTNLVTGVASAYANNIPMLVITAQTSLDTFGKGAFQESSCTGVNSLSIFESITRYNSLVSHPDQFETKLAAAVMSAFQQPCGPVHLSIPLDVMRTKTVGDKKFSNLKRHIVKPELLDQSTFEEFFALLLASKKTVFVIGNEASEAIGSLLDLAVWLDIPIVVTPHGKGLVSPYHPLFKGVIGFAGHRSALETIRNPEVDLVVAIGTSLGEWATNAWDGNTLLNSRLVHVESSENHFIGSPMAKLHLRGSLAFIFDHVKEKLLAMDFPPRLDQAIIRQASENKELHFTLDDPGSGNDHRSPVLPQDLMSVLPDLFPNHTRYLADTGNSFAWGIHYLHPYDRRMAGKRDAKGGLFKACLEFASMGWAIASSIGTALALPGTPVVCITGDGSYLMSAQEITVAIQQQLPVIYIILNDSAYGMVKHGQRLTGAEQYGYELPQVNYADMAKSMGVSAYNVRSMAELRSLDVQSMCRAKGPTLIDVIIDSEAKPPLGVRAAVLKDK